MFQLLSAMFYAFTVFVLIHEFMGIMQYKKTFLKYNKYQAQVDSGEEGSLLFVKENPLVALFHTAYMVWVVIGLFTSQWMWFGGLLLLTIFFGLTNLRRKYAIFILIDSSLTVLILLGMVICKFHPEALKYLQ